MKNKETLRAAMDRRLSFLDERPSCRAAVQYRIAQEEEPVMKKKISVALVCAVALLLITTVVLAATGTLQNWFMPMSTQASAAQAADHALLEKYGITAEMQTFFGRKETELADGSVEVTYTGVGNMAYVLGTYTAVVKDGTAEISWSHDGEDTSGGYDAEAWGLPQLQQMMTDSLEHETKKAYQQKAVGIAEKHDALEDIASYAMTDAEIDAYYTQLEADKTAAMKARQLSEEEMVRIGREFIINNYGLNEEQTARMSLYTDISTEENNYWYYMIGGRPCFQVEYLLYADIIEQDGVINRTEKDGYYNVYVNVETGIVEEYEYNSALAGEG
jgi:FlaG/FlaF family flagellin (archaellin)